VSSSVRKIVCVLDSVRTIVCPPALIGRFAK